MKTTGNGAFGVNDKRCHTTSLRCQIMYNLLSNELDIAMVIEEEHCTVTFVFYTDDFTYHTCQNMKYIHKCNYFDVHFLSRFVLHKISVANYRFFLFLYIYQEETLNNV